MMAVMSCNTGPVYIWDDSYFYTLIARFLGPTWGPSGADRTQVGPMLAPWTLLSGYTFIRFQQNCNATKQYHEIHSICRLIKIGICRRSSADHDEIIKWKHFPRYWPFVRRIHRSPVNSHRKGQWRGTLMFSLICAWINGWVNNRGACDLGHCAHYDVTVMHKHYATHRKSQDYVCGKGRYFAKTKHYFRREHL